MATFLNQPDGSDACCDPCDRAGPCEDCDNELSADFECVSTSGSTDHCGFPQMNTLDGASFNDDVNLRLYSTYTKSGVLKCGSRSSTALLCSAGTFERVEWSEFRGSAVVSNCALTDNREAQGRQTTASPPGTSWDTEPAVTTSWISYPYALTTCADVGSLSYTETTLTQTAAYCDSYSVGMDTFYRSAKGDGADTLSDPVGPPTDFGGTLGTSCTTQFTSWTLGTNYSAGWSIYVFTGVAVQATITMTGVTSGTSYDLTIELSRYNTSTTATDTVYDIVTVEADATGTDTYAYQVPLIDGYEYTIVDVSIAAA